MHFIFTELASTNYLKSKRISFIKYCIILLTFIGISVFLTNTTNSANRTPTPILGYSTEYERIPKDSLEGWGPNAFEGNSTKVKLVLCSLSAHHRSRIKIIEVRTVRVTVIPSF